MRSRWFPVPLLLAGTASLASAQVDYVRDVKPILAKHCYRCHGASQQKGGLRADTVAFMKEGGDTGASLAPGDSKASILVQVLLGTHEDISQMPYKKPALADADIAAIRAWIDAGAAAPVNEVPDKAVHWSFVAPVRPDVPAVARRDWSRTVVDRFILARLEKEKIAPAPEADRAALLRRVSLDLTGLPPTPAESAAFLADRAPDAYERAVGRLQAHVPKPADPHRLTVEIGEFTRD